MSDGKPTPDEGPPASFRAMDPEPPAPDSLDAITRDRKQRSRRLVLVGGGLLVALVAGAVGLLRYQDAQHRREVSTAWGSFARCLLGRPLEGSERPSALFRARQLGAMALTDAERTAEGTDKPWPASCAPLGHATTEALRAAALAEADRKDLAADSEALAKLLAEPSAPSADLSEALESTFEAARAEHVDADPGAPAPKGPLPTTPLVASSLAAVEPVGRTAFPLKAAYTDAHPGRVLHVLVEEPSVAKAPFLCAFGAAPTATCASLPASIAKGHPGLRLLGTADDDAEPLVFTGNRGDTGIFRADTGEQVESLFSYGGYARKGGESATLGWLEKKRKLELSRKRGAGAHDRTIIDPDFRVGNFFYSSQILWDQVVLRGVTSRDERRLFALPYAFQGELGAFVDIGELPEPGLVDGGPDEAPHIQGCRTPQMTVVRVKGSDNDFMSFLVGGKWSQPVSPQVTGGLLSCHGAEAVITRLEPAAEDRSWKTSISQAKCTPAGCQGYVVHVEPFLKMHFDLAPHGGHIDAVDLDGSLLVVWQAGERGGIRMRLGPPDQIERAADVVLFDDLTNDGQGQKLSTLFDLRLFSREGFAVLLLSTVAGVHALRIDPGGKLTPIAVTWK